MRSCDVISAEIQATFGYVPALFRPVLRQPELLELLWQQLQGGLLLNPIPPLLRHRLALRWARHSAAPYALLSHCAGLHALGVRAYTILDLLEAALPQADLELDLHLERLELLSPQTWPAAGAPVELSLLAVSEYVYVDGHRAADCQARIALALGPERFAAWASLIGYARAMHQWTSCYPELRVEDDPPVWQRLTGLLAEEPRLGELLQDYRRIALGELRSMTAKHAIAQQALEETEARARAVLDTAAEAIVTVDDEGRAETYNAAARRIFGYRAEEVLSRPVALLFPWPLPAELPRPNGTSPASRGEVLTRGHRLTGRRKDGTQVPLELSVSLLRVGTRAIYTCIARDITARVQAEAALEVRSEELARSNAELEQFAYIASHDLQQPLRSVVTFLQLLSRRYQGKLDTQADEYITFAVDGAKRMQTLISDLLAYSRVQRAETPPARVELNALLTEVQENLRGSIEAAGAQLVVWPLPTVLGQSSQLVQLFQNLVDNAIKFRGSATPRVEIGFEARGDEWVFHVKDNGIGLDPAYADKIFVLFQRLHGRGEYPGTGVGLAVAKKIVEQHGGRIWVESRPGQGSTFFFTLPAQTA